MKTLGIVGGIGPESTVLYYRSIITAYREQAPDGGFPPVIIDSIDMKKMLGLIAADKLPPVAEYLAAEVQRLASAGAEIGLLAAVTPHIVFDEVQRQSSIPLISIVEATRDAAKAMGLKKLGLFGARFTMQGRFFSDVFSSDGIIVVPPDANEQAYVHDIYMNELVKGVVRDATRERLLALADQLKDREAIEGLILGGTELSLILGNATGRGIPVLDALKIHVHSAVAQMTAPLQ